MCVPDVHLIIIQFCRAEPTDEPTDAGEQPLDRQHEVTETDEERETRLALRRARYRARRAARSLPARETRLQQMRFAARHRRAAESSADREGRHVNANNITLIANYICINTNETTYIAAFISIAVYYSCSIINDLSSQYKFIQCVMHCMTLC